LLFLRKLRQKYPADIYTSIYERGSSYFRFAKIVVAVEAAVRAIAAVAKERLLEKLWLPQGKLHYSRYDTGSTGGQYKIYVRAICISDIFIIPDTFWNNALRASAYKVRQIASVKDMRSAI